jgi:hypothetical protein
MEKKIKKKISRSFENDPDLSSVLRYVDNFYKFENLIPNRATLPAANTSFAQLIHSTRNMKKNFRAMDPNAGRQP